MVLRTASALRLTCASDCERYHCQSSHRRDHPINVVCADLKKIGPNSSADRAR
jgi:hypothetical protein